MKHRTNRWLRPSRRSYRVAAGTGIALAAALTAGVLVTQGQSNPPADTGPSTHIAAELAGAGENQIAPVATGSASPAASTPATPASPTSTASPTTPPPPPAPKPKPKPKPPSSKVLDFEYQVQINYYYCGPAATRIALTAKGKAPTQDDVASRLGTTEMGTNSAEDTTRVLNNVIGTDFYRTRTVQGGSAAEVDRMQGDVVRAITNGYVLVVNVAGSGVDVDGGWHAYDGGHYLTVVGYRDDGNTVKIADPANPNVSSYWMSAANITAWAAGHGYSA